MLIAMINAGKGSIELKNQNKQGNGVEAQQEMDTAERSPTPRSELS